MLTPEGSPVADHVTVPLLPLTVNVTLTAEPVVTFTVLVDGVIVSVPGAVTVMVMVDVADLPAASLAVTVTL